MYFGLNKSFARIRSSLSTRLTLLFCLTFFVCLLMALVFAYFQVARTLENASRSVISAKSREMATLLQKEGVAGLREFLKTEQNRIRNSNFLVRVTNEDGEMLFFKPPIEAEQFDLVKVFAKRSTVKPIVGWDSFPAVGDEDSLDVLTEKMPDNLFLQIGRSSEDRDDVLENLLLAFGIAILIFSLVSGFFGAWYANRSLAPIRALTKTIHSIEAGDLSRRVPLANSTEARGELRDLGETFNRMIGRIETLVLAMRDSLDGVAHDIRTPLTRIRASAETAILSKRGDLALLALEDCAENISEVTALVDQLLDISEADAGVVRLKLEESNIQRLLEEVIEVYTFVAEEKKTEISLSIDSKLIWRLDRRRIKQVVANLIDNAIKYSADGSSVKVLADVVNDRLEISVADHGIGISNEDLPRIWDRLYRGDKSRATKGLGLGLSLARAIAVAHGGAVVASSDLRHGTTFVVTLPSNV